MPFAAAQVLVEVPYLLAQAILFSVISYPMVHFEANPGQSLSHYCMWTICNLLHEGPLEDLGTHPCQKSPSSCAQPSPAHSFLTVRKNFDRTRQAARQGAGHTNLRYLTAYKQAES